MAALVSHLIEEVWFASDSPLEGAGFEPSVPLAKRVGLFGGTRAAGRHGETATANGG